MDNMDRNRVEGYGLVEVPHTPGFHQLVVSTFKPEDDVYTKIIQFYLGGTIRVKELKNISNTLNHHNLVLKIIFIFYINIEY